MIRGGLKILQRVQKFLGLGTISIVLIHSNILNEALVIDDGSGGVRHFSRLLIKNTPCLGRFIVWVVKDGKIELEILAEFGQGFRFIG